MPKYSSKNARPALVYLNHSAGWICEATDWRANRRIGYLPLLSSHTLYGPACIEKLYGLSFFVFGKVQRLAPLAPSATALSRVVETTCQSAGAVTMSW